MFVGGDPGQLTLEGKNIGRGQMGRVQQMETGGKIWGRPMDYGAPTFNKVAVAARWGANTENGVFGRPRGKHDRQGPT